MTIISAWLRLELRRRWRSLTVLALLIAVAGGTVMTALAGARRGASTQERLNARTLPADAMILANTPGFDWNPIERLPEVAALTKFVVDYNMTPVGFSGDGLSFPPADDRFMRTIEKPVVFEGRAPDPTRPDEAAVSRQFVSTYHKGVGDTVALILATPQEITNQAGSGPGGRYTGPRVTLHIVGVGEPSSRWGADSPGGHGGLALSPALYERYRANIVGPSKTSINYINAILRLRGGESRFAQLEHDVKRLTGRADIEVVDLVAGQRVTQRHMAFEARCLVAFAVAAFIAALFLVGQAIARYAAASTDELRTLRAIGMTPGEQIRTATAAPAIAGVMGAVLGVGGAVVASRWMPFGAAGLLEPSPGMSWDWVVFGPALGLVILLAAGGAAVAGWAALAAARREGGKRRSAVAAAVGRSRVPVPVVIGTRFALEAGRGRASVPVRPALVGAVTGVLGVVAAFTFSRGVSDASSHPERFGQTFQLGAFMGINGQDFAPTDKLIAALRKQPQVSGVDDARTAVATDRATRASVSLYAYSPGPKALPIVILSGRLPEAANEVLLAPRTITALDTHVGGRVQLTGTTKRPVTLSVVGSALVPNGPHNGYADGGWVTPHGYDALFDGFKFHIVLVTLRPDARGPGAVARLTAAVAATDPALKGVGLGPPDPLPEIAQLREVRTLPIFLGVFLVLLALGAVGHALATAVRRRSHDLAVLRAVGMTQWQCRAVVVTQATVLALVGLVFGVPLGLSIGRSVWRIVADYTPIAYVAPTALWALALVGPAALVVANLLAAWPGQRAARLRVAHVLRAE